MSRLVLIEDDESVRRSMTMMMRARGFQIDAYRNGTEFLMMRGQHGGDCLLIDYKMPRVDGLEVMRRLRAQNDATPAIMITGYYSATLRDKAILAGYADILEKPSTPDAVIEAVSRLMN
ncbi:MAG: response regulator [Henriciella sp.]|nr:response regulator [Hyphomonadaceae bacterium]